MQTTNILVTGTPRSGTTLTCFLLNKVENTVALHEPKIAFEAEADADPTRNDRYIGAVRKHIDMQRASLLATGSAQSLHVGGKVPDNHISAKGRGNRQRRSIADYGEVRFDKPLTADFTLIVKHPAPFTALLPILSDAFPMYAIVRNPLATLGSWNSVHLPISRGHLPAAERLEPRLEASLNQIADRLDRQIFLMNWFYERFQRHLPRTSIIGYEQIVATGGAALAPIAPGAAALAEPLSSRNTSKQYGHDTVRRLGERLLAADGAWWTIYPRATVEALLSEIDRPAAVVTAE